VDIKILTIHVRNQDETVLDLYGPFAEAPLANLDIFLAFIQRAVEIKSPYGKVALDKSSYAYATELAGSDLGCPASLVIDFELDNEVYYITVAFDREDNNAYIRKRNTKTKG
jgi:hypothetical protein